MHHPTCEAHGGNAASDSKVRKWVRLFKKVWKASTSNRILIGYLQSIAKYWQLFGQAGCFVIGIFLQGSPLPPSEDPSVLQAFSYERD
ncbi:hypothetical protein AVEN_181925-1 [Araneus ventricosus]|uniref:Uncharacterized protein n=1 Tax=Araneus ventricosus TaxID=182803 RepID=A0A4Y1ZW63_ARAVE|nr:hypothetical protein AVEN_118219-1 [Araneus ventricosus]GBL69784.1 hypothetical protein AVEN_181925-1 [Araneus ventricosus]